MIQIARDGEILGYVELAQIPDAVAQGTVLITDHYWAEGMPEWRLVEELTPSPQDNQDIVAELQPAEEPLKPANNKRDWRSDPATAKQITFLESLGVGVTGPITKGEASELIDRYKDSPEAYAYQERKREEDRQRRSDFPSFHMKVDIDRVSAEIEKIKAELRKCPQVERQKDALYQRIDLEEDPDRAIELEAQLDELESSSIGDEDDLKMDLSDLKDELKSLQSLRSRFWRFTFRADWVDGDPDMELTDFGDAINQYHSLHGRYLVVPTLKEVKEILADLDSTQPGWDQTMPEAFYTRYYSRNPDAFLPPNKIQ